jgi:hypothetical protein
VTHVTVAYGERGKPFRFFGWGGVWMLLRSTLIVCVCVLTYGTHCKSFYKLFLYLVVVVVFVVMVRSFQACRAQNIVSSLKKPGWKRLSYSVPVLSALLSVFFFFLFFLSDLNY